MTYELYISKQAPRKAIEFRLDAVVPYVQDIKTRYFSLIISMLRIWNTINLISWFLFIENAKLYLEVINNLTICPSIQLGE